MSFWKKRKIRIVGGLHCECSSDNGFVGQPVSMMCEGEPPDDLEDMLIHGYCARYFCRLYVTWKKTTGIGGIKTLTPSTHLLQAQ